MPTIEWIAVDVLKPNARNARTHSRKQIRQIADSIATFGFLVPILVDEGRVVIAGHGRYAAAKLLGLKQVPAIEVRDLSEAKRRALALADNKIADNAGWDRDLLAAELPELAELLVVEGLDISITGFAPVEIDQLTADFEDDPSDPADTVNPGWATAAVVTRRVDFWHLGHHRLLCGDARGADELARLMGGGQAAMAFLDPPYNVRVRDIVGRGRVKHTEFAMASGELSRPDFVEFLKSTLAAAAAISRDGAAHFVCMDWRHIGELLEAGGAVYDNVLNLAVWVKSNAGQGSFYRSQHELIGVFRVGEEPHLNNVELGRLGRSRSNVWHYAGVNTFRAGRLDDLESHPTVKPRPGSGCHEGLHPPRRHRTRHLLWLRHDDPGGGKGRTPGLHAGARASLRRRGHQALAGLHAQGRHSRRDRPDLRRSRQRARRGTQRRVN